MTTVSLKRYYLKASGFQPWLRSGNSHTKKTICFHWLPAGLVFIRNTFQPWLRSANSHNKKTPIFFHSKHLAFSRTCVHQKHIFKFCIYVTI